jgi:hypothetical protein
MGVVIRSQGKDRLYWHGAVIERYYAGVEWLADREVKLRIPNEEFAAWIRGYTNPQDLVDEFPAFATLTGELPYTDIRGWAPKERTPMPGWLREEYVAVCLAYRASRKKGFEFSDRLTEVLKQVYPRDRMTQMVMRGVLFGEGLRRVRWE